MHIYASGERERAYGVEEWRIRVGRANELCSQTETEAKPETERAAPRGRPTTQPKQRESKYKYK